MLETSKRLDSGFWISKILDSTSKRLDIQLFGCLQWIGSASKILDSGFWISGLLDQCPISWIQRIGLSWHTSCFKARTVPAGGPALAFARTVPAGGPALAFARTVPAGGPALAFARTVPAGGPFGSRASPNPPGEGRAALRPVPGGPAARSGVGRVPTLPARVGRPCGPSRAALGGPFGSGESQPSAQVGPPQGSIDRSGGPTCGGPFGSRASPNPRRAGRAARSGGPAARFGPFGRPCGPFRPVPGGPAARFGPFRAALRPVSARSGRPCGPFRPVPGGPAARFGPFRAALRPVSARSGRPNLRGPFGSRASPNPPGEGRAALRPVPGGPGRPVRVGRVPTLGAGWAAPGFDRSFGRPNLRRPVRESGEFQPSPGGSGGPAARPGVGRVPTLPARVGRPCGPSGRPCAARSGVGRVPTLPARVGRPCGPSRAALGGPFGSGESQPSAQVGPPQGSIDRSGGPTCGGPFGSRASPNPRRAGRAARFGRPCGPFRPVPGGPAARFGPFRAALRPVSARSGRPCGPFRPVPGGPTCAARSGVGRVPTLPARVGRPCGPSRAALGGPFGSGESQPSAQVGPPQGSIDRSGGPTCGGPFGSRASPNPRRAGRAALRPVRESGESQPSRRGSGDPAARPGGPAARSGVGRVPTLPARGGRPCGPSRAALGGPFGSGESQPSAQVGPPQGSIDRSGGPTCGGPFGSRASPNPRRAGRAARSGGPAARFGPFRAALRPVSARSGRPCGPFRPVPGGPAARFGPFRAALRPVSARSGRPCGPFRPVPGGPAARFGPFRAALRPVSARSGRPNLRGPFGSRASPNPPGEGRAALRPVPGGPGRPVRVGRVPTLGAGWAAPGFDRSFGRPNLRRPVRESGESQPSPGGSGGPAARPGVGRVPTLPARVGRPCGPSGRPCAARSGVGRVPTLPARVGRPCGPSRAALGGPFGSGESQPSAQVGPPQGSIDRSGGPTCGGPFGSRASPNPRRAGRAARFGRPCGPVSARSGRPCGPFRPVPGGPAARFGPFRAALRPVSARSGRPNLRGPFGSRASPNPPGEGRAALRPVPGGPGRPVRVGRVPTLGAGWAAPGFDRSFGRPNLRRPVRESCESQPSPGGSGGPAARPGVGRVPTLPARVGRPCGPSGRPCGPFGSRASPNPPGEGRAALRPVPGGPGRPVRVGRVPTLGAGWAAPGFDRSFGRPNLRRPVRESGESQPSPGGSGGPFGRPCGPFRPVPGGPAARFGPFRAALRPVSARSGRPCGPLRPVSGGPAARFGPFGRPCGPFRPVPGGPAARFGPFRAALRPVSARSGRPCGPFRPVPGGPTCAARSGVGRVPTLPARVGRPCGPSRAALGGPFGSGESQPSAQGWAAPGFDRSFGRPNLRRPVRESGESQPSPGGSGGPAARPGVGRVPTLPARVGRPCGPSGRPCAARSGVGRVPTLPARVGRPCGPSRAALGGPFGSGESQPSAQVGPPQGSIDRSGGPTCGGPFGSRASPNPRRAGRAARFGRPCGPFRPVPGGPAARFGPFRAALRPVSARFGRPNLRGPFGSRASPNPPGEGRAALRPVPGGPGRPVRVGRVPTLGAGWAAPGFDRSFGRPNLRRPVRESGEFQPSPGGSGGPFGSGESQPSPGGSGGPAARPGVGRVPTLAGRVGRPVHEKRGGPGWAAAQVKFGVSVLVSQGRARPDSRRDTAQSRGAVVDD